MDETHSESPHFHVSELQHCASVPTQVALLCLGPQSPSVARTGSITMPLSVHVFKGGFKSALTSDDAVVSVWLNVGTVPFQFRVQQKELVNSDPKFVCELFARIVVDIRVRSPCLTAIDIAWLQRISLVPCNGLAFIREDGDAKQEEEPADIGKN